MIHTGDVRDVLPTLEENSVQCVVTSPPYWGLRDYGVEGQIGLEPSPDEYIANLVEIFTQIKRVLRDDGTCWLNMGDGYANDGKWGGATSGKHASGLHGASGMDRTKVTTGLKPKDMIGMPWRLAFALQADGWWLRSDIIWHKTNPMPESITDRPTKAHEYLFLLTNSASYFYDADTVRSRPLPDSLKTQRRHSGEMKRAALGEMARTTPVGRTCGVHELGCNLRTVWTIPTQAYPESHFATFPEKLVEPCIMAGTSSGDIVLDPFFGSGTVGKVAERLGRKWIGIELNPQYVEQAKRRTSQMGLTL